MTRYAAFLRGVNVGGVNLKMAEVAETFRNAGLADVRTILASGNVIFAADSDAATLRDTIETALRAQFGYEAWVLVYDLGAVKAILDGYPFEPEVDGYQSYVTFVSDSAVLDELSGLSGPDEKVARGDGVIYWQVPTSTTLTSTIGKTMGNRRFKSTTTTRNLRTLGKVLG